MTKLKYGISGRGYGKESMTDVPSGELLPVRVNPEKWDFSKKKHSKNRNKPINWGDDMSGRSRKSKRPLRGNTIRQAEDKDGHKIITINELAPEHKKREKTARNKKRKAQAQQSRQAQIQQAQKIKSDIDTYIDSCGKCLSSLPYGKVAVIHVDSEDNKAFVQLIRLLIDKRAAVLTAALVQESGVFKEGAFPLTNIKAFAFKYGKELLVCRIKSVPKWSKKGQVLLYTVTVTGMLKSSKKLSGNYFRGSSKPFGNITVYKHVEKDLTPQHD